MFLRWSPIKAVTSLVKENLESNVHAEIKHYMGEEPGGEHNSGNGYCKQQFMN